LGYLALEVAGKSGRMEVDIMGLQVIVSGDQRVLEGVAGARVLESAEDVVEVIGACFEHGVGSVLLYGENLTEGFFDLSSGEAGVVLQKLRNYRIRVAVVVSSQGGTRQSDRFREMMVEESRGNDFRVFEDRVEAVGWLVGG
jgi:Domain of unknown function (DUF4180)